MSILDKKSWTWEGSLVDHIRILTHFPFFFVAPFVLQPEACETIHLSLNSVNGCKFCTDLHGELGRMAGLQDSYGLMTTGNLSSDEEKKDFGLYADYGRSFAQNNGRGKDLLEKYDAIVAEYGAMSARSAEGLAYFLWWGSLGGNTILGFLNGTLQGNPKDGSNVIFEIIFVLYYGLLFLIIDLTSRLLKLFPAGVPKLLSIVLGLILPAVAGVWIVPYGLVALAAKLLGSLAFVNVEALSFLQQEDDGLTNSYLGAGSSYSSLP